MEPIRLNIELKASGGCDFCSSKVAVGHGWIWETEPRPASEPLTTRTITEEGIMNFHDYGAWLGCDACKTIVATEAPDLEALFRRASHIYGKAGYTLMKNKLIPIWRMFLASRQAAEPTPWDGIIGAGPG